MAQAHRADDAHRDFIARGFRDLGALVTVDELALVSSKAGLSSTTLHIPPPPILGISVAPPLPIR